MMNATAIFNVNQSTTDSGTCLRMATVSGRADEWFFVDDLSIRRVRRAVGCLVEPEVGDLVLLCEAPSEQARFILSVLSRERADAGNICLPGGVTLQTESKHLTVSANGINLQGRDSVGLVTAHLDVNVVAATTRVSHLQNWSQSIESTTERVTLITQTLTQHLGRMITRVRESWRKVDGLDETQAARMRVYVQGSHQVDAEHVTVNAEGFVRIDGKSINIG
jgi:hypothetical protein